MEYVIYVFFFFHLVWFVNRSRHLHRTDCINYIYFLWIFTPFHTKHIHFQWNSHYFHRIWFEICMQFVWQQQKQQKQQKKNLTDIYVWQDPWATKEPQFFLSQRKKCVKQTTNFLMNLIMFYGFSCRFSLFQRIYTLFTW